MNLKKLKRNVCSVCKKKGQSGIPLERCVKCGDKFCPDHFNRGFYSKKLINRKDWFGVVCDACKEEFDYVDLKNYILREETQN